MNIKAKIVESGKTMTEVAELLSVKYNKTISVQSLSNKIRRDAIKLSDVEDIADVLGYEIVWKKKLTTEISQHIDKFQTDIEYRRECRKNQAQELADMAIKESHNND